MWGIDAQYDIVRATFTDGSNVPRIPPQRLGGGVYWRDANWFARVGLLHAFSQNDIAANETPTAGYNLLKAELTYRKGLDPLYNGGMNEIAFGIIGNNLLDDDVRNHVSFKKDEVLLPGRGVKLFYSAKFGGEDKARPIYKAPIYKAEAPVLAAWNWTGFYLGANAGYSAGGSHTDTTFTDTTLGPPPALVANSYAPFDGAIGGVQAGFNWQSGVFVAGLEAESRARASAAGPASNAPAPPAIPGLVDDSPVTATLEQRLQWFGTLRARLGTAALPGVLAYVTGGAAVAGIETSGTISGFDGAGTPVDTPSAAAPPEWDWRLAPGSRALSAATGPASSSTSTWTSARSRPTRRIRRTRRRSRSTSTRAFTTTCSGSG